jgi:hypothetical protein
MIKDKKTAKGPTGYRIYSQYVLVGAAIGLYYGIFNRAALTTPDYGMAVILAVLAGALTTVVRSWKKQRSFREIALDFLKITGLFMVFLLALQLRSVIEGFGGRVLVIVFMTIIGIFFGLVIGMRPKPAR